MSKKKQLPTIKLSEQEYLVDDVSGFTLGVFAKCMKAKFDTFDGMKRETRFYGPLYDYLEDIWDGIVDLTFKECLQEQNTERRRVMFTALGPEKIFNDPTMKPELLDQQTITKKRYEWDDKLKEFEKVFEDQYALYRIDGTTLLGNDNTTSWGRNAGRVFWIFAVQCYCTTTGREYWLMVPEEAGKNDEPNGKEWDAIKAIAWTIQIDMKNPKRIYRQGDVVIAEYPDNPEEAEFVKSNSDGTPNIGPITKEQYLSLMYSET